MANYTSPTYPTDNINWNFKYDVTVTATTTTSYTLRFDFYIGRPSINSSSYFMHTGKMWTFTGEVTSGSTTETESSTYTGSGRVDVASGAFVKVTSATVTLNKSFSTSTNVTVSGSFVKAGTTWTGHPQSSEGGSGTLTLTANYTPPAVTYGKCTSPDTFTATPDLPYADIFNNTLTFRWSGASGGENNDIVGYYLRYATKATQSANWSSWQDVCDVTDLTQQNTDYEIELSDKFVVQPGYYVKFAIRANGEAGSSYHSDWLFPDTIMRRLPGNMFPSVKVGNEWKSGELFIKTANGWKLVVNAADY